MRIITSYHIWLVVEPTTPLKNDGVRQLGWDDSPNIWKVIKIHGSTNQLLIG
jgi:nicotinamide riboside kinase